MCSTSDPPTIQRRLLRRTASTLRRVSQFSSRVPSFRGPESQAWQTWLRWHAYGEFNLLRATNGTLRCLVFVGGTLLSTGWCLRPAAASARKIHGRLWTVFGRLENQINQNVFQCDPTALPAIQQYAKHCATNGIVPYPFLFGTFTSRL